MAKSFGKVEIEITRGDIANQPDMTAIVNAANAHLRIGGGVAGAIHKAAGPRLEQECRPFAPIKPGQAVITGGHNLPNDYVIHCLGPVYGSDKPEPELLAACYRNALTLADQKKIDSIAFPAISAGAFGYPLEAATDIALNAVRKAASKLKHVKKIRFVLFGDTAYKVYQDKLEKLT